MSDAERDRENALPLGFFHRGYIVKPARPTGGKAGKGCNRTSTIQVFSPNGQNILRAVPFRVDDPASRTAANRKAREFVDARIAATAPTDHA